MGAEASAAACTRHWRDPAQTSPWPRHPPTHLLPHLPGRVQRVHWVAAAARQIRQVERQAGGGGGQEAGGSSQGLKRAVLDQLRVKATFACVPNLAAGMGEGEWRGGGGFKSAAVAAGMQGGGWRRRRALLSARQLPASSVGPGTSH